LDTRLKEMFDIAEDRTDVEEFRRRVHQDDKGRVWAAVEAAIDPTNPKPYATEFRHRRGDGEVRWIEAHALVHFEGGGRERRAVSMVGTAQDITQRKRREEERRQQQEREHLLMREVNHRAKNILSVVDAIARQTAARNHEDFIERFSERIQALSANQDLLIRNRWQGVEIEDLVRAQLSPFADLMGSRIVVRGPKLRLNAASAQAVGLALHELATNAGKYGALSTDRGRVDICWTDGETFTMSWVERQGPPVSTPERRGFGTTVMEAMAERSVDGTVDLDYAPSGLAWRLTCPAANALEPANSQVEGN
jgi:two-component sensor histidine kinase